MHRLLTAAAAALMGITLVGASPAAARPAAGTSLPKTIVAPKAAPVVSRTPAVPAATKHTHARTTAAHKHVRPAKHATHAKKVLTKKKGDKTAKPKAGVKKGGKHQAKRAR